MRETWPFAVCRRLGLWTMVLVVALVALVPAGLMPARGTDDALTLVLCTPEGPVSLTVDPATGEPEQAAPDRCAWAMAHAAALLPAPLRVATPAPRAAVPLRLALATLPARQDRQPAPLPRGPPFPA